MGPELSDLLSRKRSKSQLRLCGEELRLRGRDASTSHCYRAAWVPFQHSGHSNAGEQPHQVWELQLHPPPKVRTQVLMPQALMLETNQKLVPRELSFYSF